jgi:UDP-N-acetylglucosamine 2-epimerase (non-hydrolysing)
MMKIAVLIGTRPGIIKMAPIVHELKSQGVHQILIHTGQHYSGRMDKNIIDDVGLPKPDFHLVRPKNCISHAQQTAYMLTGLEKIFLQEKPDILLVCGDANTNMAGALAARKIHIKVGHVEAGLRSFDWRMPEEHNRVIIDHISDYLFAPTDLSRQNLETDGVNGEIFVVGNTIVDATLQNVRCSLRIHSEYSKRLEEKKPYALLTLHREENVDNKEILKSLLESIKSMSQRFGLKFFFPIHPRTKKRIDEFRLSELLHSIKNARLIEPLNYLKFLNLLVHSNFILTDSGGLQEESCILGKPCITLRNNTERQETVKIGANHIVGSDPNKLMEAVAKVIDGTNLNYTWRNPYGDGKASERIVETCLYGSPNSEYKQNVSFLAKTNILN